MYCPNCGHANNDYATYCAHCNLAMPAVDKPATPVQIAFTPAQPQAQSEYTHIDYYQAFIGPNNQDYYLSKFARFDKAGHAGASWHWPAFFVTFFWFCYRKLWGHAVVYLLIGAFGLPTVSIISAISPIAGGLAALIFFFGIVLLPPLFANAIYYNACRKRIKMLRTSPQRDERKKLERLYDQAGSSMVGPVIGLGAMLVCAVPLIGILAAIAIPAYQDYTLRANTAAALAAGEPAKNAIGNYYSQNGTLPANLTQAGFHQPTHTSMTDPVARIDFDNQTGYIYIRLSKEQLSENGQTPSVVFAPVLTAHALSWQCGGENINKKYLPQNCREELPKPNSEEQSAAG